MSGFGFIQRLLGSLLSRIHPKIRKGSDNKLRVSRNGVSSFFISLLVGLAYQEMFAPVRDSVRARGITLDVVCLAIVFFLTSMRFFIGNSLHLLSDELAEADGRIWLFDFLVIVLQASNLAFLGGVCSASLSRAIPVGFIELLVSLLAIDILWIVAQELMGRLFQGLRRDFVPWPWALLNLALGGFIMSIPQLFGDWYSNLGLAALTIANIVAFMIDMVLVDHFDLI